jgi:hypothetical protein
MPVFQKLTLAYKEVFRMLFNGTGAQYCQITSIQSNALPPSLLQDTIQPYCNLSSSYARLHRLFPELLLMSNECREVARGSNREWVQRER